MKRGKRWALRVTRTSCHLTAPSSSLPSTQRSREDATIFSERTRGTAGGRFAQALWLLGQFLRATITGLVAGYSLAFVLGRSVWLEMRINTGHAIPLAVVCSILLSGVKKRSIGFRLFLLLELLAAFLLLGIYGFSLAAMLTVPAAFFRDAFHLGRISLHEIGVFLLCLLGTANALWIYAALMEKKRRGAG